MASRFLLLLFLAKFLEPVEVGLFGLLLATIGFSVLAVGGDFYTYSQRELLSRPKEEWGFVLYNQLIAIFILYSLLLPLHLFIFYFNLIPVAFIHIFFLLLISEHLAQEINRLLVAIHRPVAASLVLFIRMGLWVFILLPILWFTTIQNPLEIILYTWLASVILAILVGGSFIFKSIPLHKGKQKIDINWIKYGFKVGFVFLIATLCFRALFTLDRYAVNYLTNSDLLGVYTVYIGIAMAVFSFIDAGILSFLYPKMVSFYKQGKISEYAACKKELSQSIFIVGFSLALAASLLAPIALAWTDREIYLDHLPLLWLLLVVVIVYALGMIPHFGLYAYSRDKDIIIAHIISLVLFLVVTSIVSFISPLFATGFGLLAAFIWIGIFKQWRYNQYSNLNQARENI